MRRAVTLALAMLALAAAGASAAPERRASLPDLEDEVMCLECGTALNLSNAPVAERERAFIRREIRRGRTKEQIKDALVDRFGPAVLAMPDDEGFSLAAYLVPLGVALLAVAAVFAVIRRWRRPGRPAAAATTLDPDDERRLERELTAYDRGLVSSRWPEGARRGERRRL
jgi:cytochrome c-type biogenesis protein CcmH